MSSSNPPLSDMQRSIRQVLRDYWQLFLFQGVAMVVLGIIAIVWPVITTYAVDYYIGFLFLISGIVGLIAMFAAKDTPAFLWTLLTAALSLFAGVLLLWKPAQGAASLTIVLTAFFIVEGIFQIAASISYRNVISDSWGWMLASGCADLLLAVIIISGWPGSAAWTLGILVGASLITSGLAAIMIAVSGRAVVKTLAEASR